MRKPAIACATYAVFAYAAALAPALAGTVLDVASASTVGCYTKADLLEVIHASRGPDGEDITATAARVAAIVKKKTVSGACINIPAGQAAYSAPEWQKPADMWSGVVLLATKSGRRFYSTSWVWHFAGNVPQLIP